MYRKIVIVTLSCLFILTLNSVSSQAGWIFSSIPTGKEIKDPYLEQLFAPEFPYESIKVIDTKEGKRYVVIKAKEKVNNKKRVDYEYKTLSTRGIIFFQSGSERSNRVLISEMRLYRVTSQVPYVVEYSEAKGFHSENKGEVESVVKNEGKYLIVLINKDFGKTFKRVKLYPEKETKCPKPPFIGKYPDSKCISCTEKNKWISFLYITRDKAEDVYAYYRDKLNIHYKKVGFQYPEKSWKYSDYGMQIDSCYVGFCEVAKIGKQIDRFKKETPVISPIPSNGVVFRIVITKIGLKSIIENFSFIEVNYCIDPEVIKTNITYIRREDKNEN